MAEEKRIYLTQSDSLKKNSLEHIKLKSHIMYEEKKVSTESLKAESGDGAHRIVMLAAKQSIWCIQIVWKMA